MTRSTPLTGSCQCRAIRYTATGTPYHRTLCHCATCRGTSGAPSVAWFSVLLSDFSITQGTPKRYRSSDHGTRTFCGDYGTQLTFQEDGLDEIDVTICSLDDPESVPPEDQTFVRSMLGWMPASHALPKHATVRPEPN
jgi:hypothetical protein